MSGVMTTGFADEMQLLVKKAGAEETPEWFIIEMQGDLESRNKERPLEGQFIGDLHFTKEGVPVMIIGHHILYGKVQGLERPMVAARKMKKPTDSKISDEDGELMDLGAELNTNIEYTVQSVIRKKIIFKTRPKPIIANLPKTV
jgi:chromosome transmission fidelity protein 8